MFSIKSLTPDDQFSLQWLFKATVYYPCSFNGRRFLYKLNSLIDKILVKQSMSTYVLQLSSS